ncbi:hypothetical protein K8I61_19765 [bacterium]|nr:hypothetical protein [bacterium]
MGCGTENETNLSTLGDRPDCELCKRQTNDPHDSDSVTRRILAAAIIFFVALSTLYWARGKEKTPKIFESANGVRAAITHNAFDRKSPEFAEIMRLSSMPKVADHEETDSALYEDLLDQAIKNPEQYIPLLHEKIRRRNDALEVGRAAIALGVVGNEDSVTTLLDYVGAIGTSPQDGRQTWGVLQAARAIALLTRKNDARAKEFARRCLEGRLMWESVSSKPYLSAEIPRFMAGHCAQGLGELGTLDAYLLLKNQRYNNDEAMASNIVARTVGVERFIRSKYTQAEYLDAVMKKEFPSRIRCSYFFHNRGNSHEQIVKKFADGDRSAEVIVAMGIAAKNSPAIRIHFELLKSMLIDLKIRAPEDVRRAKALAYAIGFVALRDQYAGSDEGQIDDFVDDEARRILKLASDTKFWSLYVSSNLLDQHIDAITQELAEVARTSRYLAGDQLEDGHVRIAKKVDGSIFASTRGNRGRLLPGYFPNMCGYVQDDLGL